MTITAQSIPKLTTTNCTICSQQFTEPDKVVLHSNEVQLQKMHPVHSSCHKALSLTARKNDLKCLSCGIELAKKSSKTHSTSNPPLLKSATVIAIAKDKKTPLDVLIRLLEHPDDDVLEHAEMNISQQISQGDLSRNTIANLMVHNNRGVSNAAGFYIFAGR